jgi:AcrR family transcriptional regulator
LRSNGHSVVASSSPDGSHPSIAANPQPGTRAPHSSRANNHDKQNEIFAAALRLFQAKGYHGASMQDLADAMGMQKASLYYYIRSKEELLFRVCERGSGAFTQELRDIVASDARPTEKLERAIECHLVALCEQLDLFTVFLREQKFLGAAYKRKLRAEGKQHAALLAAILQQGVSSGEFRDINVPVTTLAILGMCNWLFEWYSPDGPLTPREIAANYAALVTKGLAAPASLKKKKRHSTVNH